MINLKKVLGIVWIAIGLAAGYVLIITQALPKFASNNPTDKIPAIIYAFILMPIITGGLCTFGWYALRGLYGNEDNNTN